MLIVVTKILFLPAFGNAILHSIGTTTFLKSIVTQIPLLTFHQTGCEIIAWDIHYPLLLFSIFFKCLR